MAEPKWGGKRKNAGRPRKQPVTLNLALNLGPGRHPETADGKERKKLAMEAVEASVFDCIAALHAIVKDIKVDVKSRVKAAEILLGKVVPTAVKQEVSVSGDVELIIDGLEAEDYM